LTVHCCHSSIGPWHVGTFPIIRRRCVSRKGWCDLKQTRDQVFGSQRSWLDAIYETAMSSTSDPPETWGAALDKARRGAYCIG
jgi:hypothetical protein